MGTGLRINNPSDDPLGLVKVFAGHAQDMQFTTFQQNISESQTILNQGVANLNDAGSVLTKAREVAIEATNSTNDAGANEALATEVDGLLKGMLDIANGKINNEFQFSGNATKTQPYVVTATDSLGRPLAVAYNGASERANIAVSPQQNVDTYYPGKDIFQNIQRGPTIYVGNTGAAAGTGTDSATGQGALLVTHTSTTYAPGSGVTAGTSSVTGDTIIGPVGAHTLTVKDTSGTGASGTIALDGGAPVAFDNTQTNLQVTGPSGEIVYVNTTNITAGFNGTVAITANGALSTDGGASSTPINFSSNQVVTNSKTGAVTNVNSTNIRLAGTDQLNYTGTYDAFQILMALRDDLRNVNHLPEDQRLQVLSTRLAEIDRVHQGVLNTVGEQSADLSNLQSLSQRTQDLQLNEKEQTSNIEDADVSQLVINYQTQQNLLRLALSAAAQISQPSLLDFLH
jgi:flagellar hook-associated protein 3